MALTMATRCSSPLKSFLQCNERLLVHCKTTVVGELSHTSFHSSPQTFYSPILSTRCVAKPVNVFQKLSSVSSQYHFVQSKRCHETLANVPQIDIDSDRDKGRDGKPKVNASEVLQNLNPDDARKLKIIQLEFDVLEMSSLGKVPSEMSDENWLHALQLPSKSQRAYYYKYLRKTEMAKEFKKKKKEARTQQKSAAEEHGKETASREQDFELPLNSRIFFRLRDSTEKRILDYRLAYAMQYGQPLVFDMDYEDYMRHQDCNSLAFQLMYCYSHNRSDPDPFHFIFTSMNPRGKVMRSLQKAQLTGSKFMGTMTDKSYLDLFPRERLVYLSPHINETLKEVNDDDVYIIGGFVDCSSPQPVSLARAKEQGIRAAKLPIDDYVLWGIGSKNLTLDQVTSILLNQRKTKDWNKAFKLLPQRKIKR